MSEKMQELWDELLSLDRESELDESIKLSTQIIELEQDAKKKTTAYYIRGYSYVRVDKNEQAIEDLTKVINIESQKKSESQNAAMYVYRGTAYRRKGNYDKSLMDSSKAIEIDSGNVEAYICHGIASSEKNDQKSALNDFNKAIELNPDNADSYVYRSFVHSRKGDSGDAIQDLTKALEGKPKDALLLHIRGIRYFQADRYELAFYDFVRAAKYNPSLKFTKPEIYLAHKTDSIYNMKNENKINEDKRWKLFESYLGILGEIQGIQKIRFYSPQGFEVAHYTSLDLLQKFSNNTRFRLYNAAYMNDPDEGRAFLEILPEEVKNFFYDKDAKCSNISPPNIDKYSNISSPNIDKYSNISPPNIGKYSILSPAYIGSFIVPNSGQCKDSLPLWRTYGGHGADEAAGACLIFKRECFEEHFETQLEGMKRRNVEHLLSRKQADKDSRVVKNKNVKPLLFRIIYVDLDKKDKDDGESENSQIFNGLNMALEELKHHIENIGDTEKQTKLKDFACELLDNIRFLVKTHHYEHEHEIRVIQLPHVDGKLEDAPDVKVDMDTIPPRLYLETIKICQLSEVIFGPRTKHIDEWKQWIKGKGEHGKKIEVTKSGIKYGRQDP